MILLAQLAVNTSGGTLCWQRCVQGSMGHAHPTQVQVCLPLAQVRHGTATGRLEFGYGLNELQTSI